MSGLAGVIKRRERDLGLRKRSGAKWKDIRGGARRLVYPAPITIRGTIQPNRDIQIEQADDVGGRVVLGQAKAYIREEYNTEEADLLVDGTATYEVKEIDDWTHDGDYRMAVLVKSAESEG